MFRNAFTLFCLLILCLPFRSALAQSYSDWYQQSLEAYEQGDYPRFLHTTQQADSMRPNHRILLYNLAVAYMLNGQPEQAVATLKKRISFYADTSFVKDEDFRLLKEKAGISPLVELARELNHLKKSSERAFMLDEEGLHPEGLAYDPINEVFLMSDIRRGEIAIYSGEGQKLRTLLTLKEKGYWSAFGIHIDSVNPEVLWVTTAAIPEFSGYKEADKGKGSLLKIHRHSGEILQVYAPPAPGPHLPGDLTQGPDGSLYITDSARPRIYKLAAGADSLEVLAEDPQWWNLQGLALSEEGQYLYVSDYILGILKMDLQTGSVDLLLSEEVQPATRGTDGLYFYRNTLYFLQNGTLPTRVGRVALDEEGQGVDSTLIFTDQSVDEISEPTLGVIVENTLYYLANSPWSSYDQDFKPRLKEWPVISVYKLPVK